MVVDQDIQSTLLHVRRGSDPDRTARQLRTFLDGDEGRVVLLLVAIEDAQIRSRIAHGCRPSGEPIMSVGVVWEPSRRMLCTALSPLLESRAREPCSDLDGRG